MKVATQNTCLSSLFLFHSLASGPVISKANHILIYFDFFLTQISVPNILSSLSSLIRNGWLDVPALYGSVSQMDQISTNKAFCSER